VLRLPVRVAAAVSSFGSGVLLAAVALELVPDADERAGQWLTAVGLFAGMLIYIGADAWLSRNEERKAHAFSEVSRLVRDGDCTRLRRRLPSQPISGQATVDTLAAVVLAASTVAVVAIVLAVIVVIGGLVYVVRSAGRGRTGPRGPAGPPGPPAP
jgi:hypothetical protein